MAAYQNAGRLIRGSTGLWNVCVGLEVHAQLAAKSKLFSPSPAAAGVAAQPNSAVSLFDAAHPGSLPMLNEGCLAQAVRAGVAFRGAVPHRTSWVRKHYSYADLPHGYQITQLDNPVVRGGFLLFDVPVRHPRTGARTRSVYPCISRLARIQLEMDSGKSMHDLARTEEASVVDLNRAGAPLLEVVGCPDLRSADEAGAFVRELAAVLRHAGVSLAKVEEGGMRVDVNVSVRRAVEGQQARDGGSGSAETLLSGGGPLWHSFAGQYESVPLPTGAAYTWVWSDEQAAALAFDRLGCGMPAYDGHTPSPPGFGERVELKNLAGARAVEGAVAAEAVRQVGLIEGGRQVERETRTYDAADGSSSRLRGKEDALDYRFMPEPDVPIVAISPSYFALLRDSVPASRADERARVGAQYGLTDAEAAVLVAAASDADAAPWDTSRGGGETRAPWRGRGDPVQYYEEAVQAALAASSPAPSPSSLPRTVHGWMMNELVGRLRAMGSASDSIPALLACSAVSAPRLGALVACVHGGTVSGKMAKRVLGLMVGQQDVEGEGGSTSCTPDPRPPALIVDALGLSQTNEPDLIAQLASRVVNEDGNAEVRAKWRAGGERVVGSLVAQVLGACGGRANPALVAAAIRSALGPQEKKEGGGGGMPHVGRKAKARAAAEAAADGTAAQTRTKAEH